MGCDVNMLTLLVVLVNVAFLPAAMAWQDLRTTLRKNLLNPSDKPPRTEDEAELKGWRKITDCCSGNDFAGTRRLQPAQVPDKIMIYDLNGHVAGMQSLVPADAFVANDCTDNPYYTKESISLGETSMMFCMTTMYFTDPSTICSFGEPEGAHEDQLLLQKGRGYHPEQLLALPKTYAEAKKDPEHWNIDWYFVMMGHHVTAKENRDDCKLKVPIQALYSWVDDECKLTGFVWAHSSTSITGNTWEKSDSYTMKWILNPPQQCSLDSADKGLVTSMHVFLYPSTKYCGTAIDFWHNTFG